MEIWAINKHAHEAVPMREGTVKFQGEPFVPKALFDELSDAFMEALEQGCGNWCDENDWYTFDHKFISAYEHGVAFALKMGWIVDDQVTR